MRKLVIIIVLSALFSCKKDKLENDKSILIGRWNWIYTHHNYGWCEGESWEEILTPESEMENFLIAFEEKGKIVFYNKNGEIEEKRIVFEYFKPYDDTHYLFSIYLNNNKDDRIGGYTDKDTLILGNFPFISQPNCESHHNYFIKE